MNASDRESPETCRSTGGRRAHKLLGRPLRDVAAWAAGGLGLLLLLVWLRADNGASKSPVQNGPAAAIEGARSIVVRDHGRKVWEFSAGHIEVSADRLHATATQIGHALLYKDGKPYLKLQAQQLRLNQYTRDMQASGAVTAEASNGVTMRTDQALWKQGENTLQAVGKVTASGPNGFSLQTDTARWLRANDHITCPGPVQASWRGLTVNSKMTSYDARHDKLTCPQPLTVVSPRATLRGTRGEASIKQKSVQFQGPMEIVIRAASLPKVGL